MRTPCIRLTAVLLLVLGFAGCATTLPENMPRGPEGHALPPQPGGPLANLEATLRPRLGAEGSAWHLLDSNEEALRWRLALCPILLQARTDVLFCLPGWTVPVLCVHREQPANRQLASRDGPFFSLSVADGADYSRFHRSDLRPPQPIAPLGCLAPVTTLQKIFSCDCRMRRSTASSSSAQKITP